MKTERLKVCDILLYKGEGFTSRLIQFGTKSPYSHVAVVVDPNIDLAIESNTGRQAGVRALDLRPLDDQKIDVVRVKDVYQYDSTKVISFLVAHLGAKFDFLGVTWLGALKAISFATGFKWKAPHRFQKAKDYFCSELCYQAFQSGGIDIVPQVDAAEVTSPADIAASEVLERVPEISVTSPV